MAKRFQSTAVVARVILAVVGLMAATISVSAAEGKPAVRPEAPAVVKPSEFQQSGWNARAKQRFMHPPVLTYTAVEDAAKYRCAVSWTDARTVHTERMESATPEFDLARIWDGMPTAGPFQVAAEALGNDGKVLAKTESKCQRIASFKGPYRPAKCGYGESGAKTVAWLLKKKPSAYVSSYPSLLLSSYIRILTAYVRLNPRGESAEQALQAAKEYGQSLLKGSTPADWAYANVPMSHNPKVFQVGRGGMAGMAYLDLCGVTKDKGWLEAAMRIADTLKKNQLLEGRWPWRVEPKTGKVLADYTSDQAEAIVLLDALIRDHGRKDLQETCDKAVAWTLENPCKTYLWQHQWDDTGLWPPYVNLSWYDTALFIEYLLRHATPKNDYEKIARALMRYIEDHFVEWEPIGNEITPGAREQYQCYSIIDWHGAHYIRICMAFHATTREDVWLKKARAMADTLTAVQHPDGFYPTWMNHKPSKEAPGELNDINYKDVWPNCSSYSGEILLRLEEYLRKEGPRSPGRP